MVVTTKAAYVYEYSPDTNYSNIYLRVRAGQSGTLMRSFIEFDISSLPATFDVAYLHVYCAYDSSARTHVANRITSAWTQTGVTWNNQPTYTSTNAASASVDTSSSGTWVVWDITSIVNDESSSTLGILLKDSTENAATTNEFVYSGLGSGNVPYITTETNRYVKTGGNDANDGTSWADADAWATVNKAATTVLDGTTVHIGFGTYNNEPANNDIAPVNAGAVGIKYLPETETTGGGTGSVIVEVN